MKVVVSIIGTATASSWSWRVEDNRGALIAQSLKTHATYVDAMRHGREHMRSVREEQRHRPEAGHGTIRHSGLTVMPERVAATYQCSREILTEALEHTTRLRLDALNDYYAASKCGNETATYIASCAIATFEERIVRLDHLIDSASRMSS